jgi:hypothetical protein
MEQRSKLKADTRAEKVREELEPMEDLKEVEQFVDHAHEMIRSIHLSTRSVARWANVVRNVASGKISSHHFHLCNTVSISTPALKRPALPNTLLERESLTTSGPDIHEGTQLLFTAISTLAFLPASHISAFETYVRTLAPTQSPPTALLHTTFLALYSVMEAILKALSRPSQLISQIAACRRDAERSYDSISRASRWPLGLLDDARQRLNEEREERARRSRVEAENLSRELRYTQQTVANELAGWRDLHERMGRRAIRELAKGVVVAEKVRLEGLQRCLRRIREAGTGIAEVGARGNELLVAIPSPTTPNGQTAAGPLPVLTETSSGVVTDDLLSELSDGVGEEVAPSKRELWANTITGETGRDGGDG